MLAPILFWTMLQASSPAKTGTQLYHSCQAAVRLWDRTGTSQSDSLDEAMAGECTAYVSGFMDAQTFQASPNICPHGATPGTLVRGYVAYMPQHPEMLDDTRAKGFIVALQQNYSCRKE